jgi:3-isopropylmalate/(R)-2-methylmalate dehydratase large subunit
MGMTMTEKILARAAGVARIKPGDLAVVDVETTVCMDTTFQPGRLQEERWLDVKKVYDPAKITIIFDHMVPAADEATATALRIGREFAQRFGIERLHDVGPDQGIAHSVVADRGYALPGTVLVGSDSHTGAGGAFNCAAKAVGRPDLVYTVITGKTWFPVGETVRYELSGKLKPGVSTKDVFLTIAGRWGAHSNQNVEYGGPGLATLSIGARRTLATMGTELSAEFVILEPDDVISDYIRSVNPGAAFFPTLPDADAVYKERRAIDLGSIEPLVALPDKVINNTVPVGEVAGRKIDQAFVGSCANGSLDDLAVVAKVVRGRKVAKGTRFIVTPGTQAVFRAALKAGYIGDIMEAGAVVTPATCGACFGGHMGVLGPDEVCITASTRNFKGRMGDPSARIYMASPATVAASALAGSIASAAAFYTGDVE